MNSAKIVSSWDCAGKAIALGELPAPAMSASIAKPPKC
jgi:hypothetical protein